MLWLVAVDKIKAIPVDKDVFQDVRHFYEAAYKYDTKDILNNDMFQKLKPRL